MELYEIKIWKWDEELHKGTYQFNNLQEATNYELGLFNGFDLCGKEPTGMSCKRVKSNPEPEKFDYVIVDENNQWQSTGHDATEETLEQDIDDVGVRLKEQGETERIELYVFKAAKLERLSWMVND